VAIFAIGWMPGFWAAIDDPAATALNPGLTQFLLSGSPASAPVW
jgi:hypothetical protein